MRSCTTADGRTFPITVIVVHQRSLNGAEEDSAGGVRVRAKRQRQAEYLANLIQALQTADPDRNITVLGDFNAFEFNDGYVDAMNVVTGTPTPDNQTAVAGDGVDLVDPDLMNLFVEEPADQRYSFVFDGNAQSLDHVLINQALGAARGGFRPRPCAHQCRLPGSRCATMRTRRRGCRITIRRSRTSSVVDARDLARHRQCRRRPTSTPGAHDDVRRRR